MLEHTVALMGTETLLKHTVSQQWELRSLLEYIVAKMGNEIIVRHIATKGKEVTVVSQK
jgi:hypothetical protein